MAIALKSTPKSGLFFDCFRPLRNSHRNSLTRNNPKQLKNSVKQRRNNHRNGDRNSRNNSLREGETVSLSRAPSLNPHRTALTPSPYGFGRAVPR
jgi:hypothetical protein